MSIKVKAIKKGYYGDEIRDVGAEFSIKGVEEIGSWMDPVGEVSEEVATAFAEVKARIKEAAKRARSANAQVAKMTDSELELEALRSENIRLLRLENERLAGLNPGTSKAEKSAKKSAAKKTAAESPPADTGTEDPLA